MAFNLQSIEGLKTQWQQLAATEISTVSSDSNIHTTVEPKDSPTEALLATMSKLNQTTQEAIDNIPIFLPVGIQQQKESKNWYPALKSLSSVQTLTTLRLLESLTISEENEPTANQVLANCLATAATTLAVGRAFRSLISSTYEPEAVQMIAQAYGNAALSPLHEIERVPKTCAKKILTELYGEAIVTRVFKLYKLNNSPHITSDNLRALLIGILANLDEAALKHIIANKEQHIKITAFAFFDQFLKHPNSNIDKRFAELEPHQLIGFLDCLRKSLIDIDLNALLSPETNYCEQVLRDINLIYYCNQRTIHPNFPVALSDVLENFKGSGQIEGAIIPLSDQSFLPLSDILSTPIDQALVSTSSSEPVSFFPKETLSCYFNSQLFPRIEVLTAGTNADEELFADIASASYRQNPLELRGLNRSDRLITPSSRSLLHGSLEPFEFLDERPPLADIADMIEKMQSGTLSLVDAQNAAVKLDPKSKALFGKHEAALFENPEPFFHLYELVKKMQEGIILENKEALQVVFQQISDPLRNSLAHKIYQLSKDPTKGSTKHWGELHAFDDLSCLFEAITSLRDTIFESSYKKIKRHASNLLSSLSSDLQVGVYYEIFRMVKPQTDDLNWGKNHAFDKVSRLVTALCLRGAINEPNPLLNRLKSRVAIPEVPASTALDIDQSAQHLTSSSTPAKYTISFKPPQYDQRPLFSSPISPSISSRYVHSPLSTSQSHRSISASRQNELPLPSTPIARTSSGLLDSHLPIIDSLLSVRELKPIQLFPRKHPLAELAELIENMKSGSPLIPDIHTAVVHLDEASKTLFTKYECALIDELSLFFELIELVKAGRTDSDLENKSSILEAFNRLPAPLRHSLAAKIFQLSKDPTKGNVENWGEIHAADDLTCLAEALDNLKTRILDSIYSKITNYASSILSSLDLVVQEKVYSEILQIGNPGSTEEDWGKKHALNISSRLITALTLAKAIDTPEIVSQQSTRREPHQGAASLLNPSLLTPKKTPLPHTPSKSQGKDVAESLNQLFSFASPFSPKKSSGLMLSPTSSARRVLFPVNPASSSIPSVSMPDIGSAQSIPLPPPPVIQFLPKLSPEELHQKSELNRLKRECEARLKFSEMYTTAPLASSQLETIHRLEGNISSCRSTISLLSKQANNADFSQNIIEALNESIKQNEKEIDEIKNSAEIRFKDFEQFKNSIKHYTTNEIKLILHEISPQMKDHTNLLDEIDELETFYTRFENEELKKICNSCSHLYNKLIVEGAGRFLFCLISTIKERIAHPELEPVHEPRPFMDQKRSRLLTNHLNSPKPMGSPGIDMSEITKFQFKRSRESHASSSSENDQPQRSSLTFASMFTPVRSRTTARNQLGREIPLTSTETPDANQIEREKRIQQRKIRIEEAQEAKYKELEANFAREKMAALAEEALKPNLQINEKRQAIESRLLIAELHEQKSLNAALGDVIKEIQFKTEEESSARSFLQQLSNWNPLVSHPFATEARLQEANAYAKRCVDSIKSSK